MIKTSWILKASDISTSGWSSGYCWHYAWALHQLKGLELYVVRAYYAPDPADLEDEAYEDAHAVVSSDGVTFQDSNGTHSSQDLLEDALFSCSNITRMVVESIPDSDFKDQYLSEYGDDEIVEAAKKIITAKT